MHAGYIYLAIAIFAEVCGTLSLKATQNFTRPIPSLIVVVGYALAFYMLSLVVKTIPVAVAYSIWCGVGIALVAIGGVLFYDEVLSINTIIGISMITIGILIVYRN